MMNKEWWMKSQMSFVRTVAGKTIGDCSSLRYWTFFLLTRACPIILNDVNWCFQHILTPLCFAGDSAGHPGV